MEKKLFVEQIRRLTHGILCVLSAKERLQRSGQFYDEGKRTNTRKRLEFELGKNKSELQKVIGSLLGDAIKVTSNLNEITTKGRFIKLHDSNSQSRSHTFYVKDRLDVWSRKRAIADGKIRIDWDIFRLREKILFKIQFRCTVWIAKNVPWVTLLKMVETDVPVGSQPMMSANIPDSGTRVKHLTHLWNWSLEIKHWLGINQVRKTPLGIVTTVRSWQKLFDYLVISTEQYLEFQNWNSLFNRPILPVCEPEVWDCVVSIAKLNNRGSDSLLKNLGGAWKRGG